MLGPEDADDEETKAEILQEFGTYGTVLQVSIGHATCAQYWTCAGHGFMAEIKCRGMA